MESKLKMRIAHLCGPNATIQNTPPLVTSNKARLRHHLPLLKDADGSVSKIQRASGSEIGCAR
jgi:L-asparaginase